MRCMGKRECVEDKLKSGGWKMSCVCAVWPRERSWESDRPSVRPVRRTQTIPFYFPFEHHKVTCEKLQQPSGQLQCGPNLGSGTIHLMLIVKKIEPIWMLEILQTDINSEEIWGSLDVRHIGLR